MSLVRLFACFLLVGCASAPATLQVAMEPGSTVPVWRGPQGGYHLEVRLAAAGFDPAGVKLSFSGTGVDSGAEVCSSSYPRAMLDAMPDPWRCFFVDDPAALVGSAVELSATAEESPGHGVSGACRVTLGEIRTVF